ncbi:MAG: hypothetical protein LBD63_01310 [Mycoplasmataceae bacterium]|jgi:uncharacterized protein with PQ loop repeat|nr:hypothetical protein [Mycoplasmataceae bacterium]
MLTTILIQLFMWVAVLLTFVLLIPGVWQVLKTRNTVGISKWMYILYPVCSIAWIIYSILLIFEATPITEVIGIAVAESLSMVLACYILIVKLKNVHNARTQHMTEAEWYRAYLKQKKEKQYLKALGINSEQDFKNHNEHQQFLSKILDQLALEHPHIVDDRITSSKQYRKTVNKAISSANKRLEHFKNIATNAEMAHTISLVYLDLYHGKIS